MPTKKPSAPPAVPKVEEPKVTETGEQKEPVKSSLVKHNYRANRHPIYHPYQEKLVPVSGMVDLYPDSWVEVQVAAKVITDLGEGK